MRGILDRHQEVNKEVVVPPNELIQLMNAQTARALLETLQLLYFLSKANRTSSVFSTENVHPSRSAGFCF